MSLLALALTSCDPSKIDGGAEWADVAADQLVVSATPITVDGKNSNEIHVVCSSPTNVAWQTDQLIEETKTVVSADAKTYVTQLGTRTVRCLTTNTGGAPVMKELTVKIDTITYLTSDISNRLCVGKTGGADHFGTTFNANDIKVKQKKTADGKPGNTLVVESNTNPVLCTFDWGGTVLTNNIGEITIYQLGVAKDLTLTTLDAAGNTKTYKLGTYTAVDYSDAPAEIKLITGCDPTDATTYSNTKTWKLEAGNNWGNGSSGDKQASWWTTDVTGQDGSYGTMTFNFTKGTITKVIADESNKRGDKSSTGTFKLDFGTWNESTNVICTLTTAGGGNIVFPYLINEDYYETHTFEVTKVTENEMWIRAQHVTNSNTGEGTFWHFVAAE